MPSELTTGSTKHPLQRDSHSNLLTYLRVLESIRVYPYGVR
jgi:hypothetical protein